MKLSSPRSGEWYTISHDTQQSIGKCSEEHQVLSTAGRVFTVGISLICRYSRRVSLNLKTWIFFFWFDTFLLNSSLSLPGRITWPHYSVWGQCTEHVLSVAHKALVSEPVHSLLSTYIPLTTHTHTHTPHTHTTHTHTTSCAKLWAFECEQYASLFWSHTVLINALKFRMRKSMISCYTVEFQCLWLLCTLEVAHAIEAHVLTIELWTHMAKSGEWVANSDHAIMVVQWKSA